MNTAITSRDIQRLTFVESLQSNLKKQATKAIEDHTKFIVLAGSYLTDGLDESECVELLMIDGLSREAAEGYTSNALNDNEESVEDLPEYSFQFEDVYGKVWSSFDVGRNIKASSEEEAWTRAEEFIFEQDRLEPQKVIAVNRIS